MSSQHFEIQKIDHPEFDNIIQFINAFNGLFQRETITPPKGFIDNQLLIALHYLNKGDIINAKKILLKFKMLFMNLDRLKGFNYPGTDRLIEKIKNCPIAQYFGIRLEISTALKLCEHNVPFITPDPPDFKFTYRYSSINIECTSRHLAIIKKQNDVVKAFGTCISKKGKFSYVDYNTVLFIDATNLGYHDTNLWHSSQSRRTRQFIQQELHQTKLGAVIVFNWVLNNQLKIYQEIYNRIDGKIIGSDLKLFLDRLYPMGNFNIGNNIELPEVG